jgi:hypothetical protein
MADLDPELLERVIHWCAEAGRQTGAREIRAALSPLGWDEILHVRALLADPPPARPLGPGALADLARGTPADIAAERERAGQYQSELTENAAEEAGDSAPEAPTAPTGARAARPRRGARRPAGPVVHRKRDQLAAEPPRPATAPALERLLEPEGRAVLERLLREHGARRAFLLGELARWRRADGAAPTDADLDALLDHHGLARAFAHRERDELLHSLRAARGDRAAASAQVGLSPEAYQQALERVGAAGEAERIRDERRADLRARATLAERCRLVTAEPERLQDLDLLAEFEADLRVRLGEHVRALRAGAAGRLVSTFARSVSLEVPDATALAARLGIDLAGAGAAGPAARSSSGPRSSGPRSGGPRSTGGRSTGPRRSGERPGGTRPRGSARPGARPGSLARSGPRTPSSEGARPFAGRSARPGGGPRQGQRGAGAPPRGAPPRSKGPGTGRPRGPGPVGRRGPSPRGGRPGK